MLKLAWLFRVPSPLLPDTVKKFALERIASSLGPWLREIALFTASESSSKVLNIQFFGELSKIMSARAWL